MRVEQMNPQFLLFGLGAGIAIFAWTNPTAFASLLASIGLATVKKAGEAAVGVASEYGAPALSVKAGDALAQTSAAQTFRGWFGLPDLTTQDTKAKCQTALASGDDWAAMVNCTPLEYSRGWVDGR